MVDNREIILAFMKKNGPSLPAAIAKELKTSLLFGSAHLAEMTATGKLKTSNLKIGGSPLYLIPGQENLLENFSQNLGEKDKRTYDLLKESKVLNDRELDPLTRVALRNIKDFAVAINVSHDGADELFWKWHSLSNQEVEQIFREMSGEKEEPRTAPKKEVKEVLKEEKQKTLPTPKPAKQEEPIQQPALKPESSPVSSIQTPVQKKEKKEKTQKQPDEFGEEIAKFFVKNGIIVKEQNIIKKNTEIEYVIGVPSVFGSLEHYCRAKNKKKLTDSDVSSAFVQGQFRKLPVILLSPGELNKKGGEVLGSLKGLMFYRLE